MYACKYSSYLLRLHLEQIAPDLSRAKQDKSRSYICIMYSIYMRYITKNISRSSKETCRWDKCCRRSVNTHDHYSRIDRFSILLNGTKFRLHLHFGLMWQYSETGFSLCTYSWLIWSMYIYIYIADILLTDLVKIFLEKCQFHTIAVTVNVALLAGEIPPCIVARVQLSEGLASLYVAISTVVYARW